MCYDKILKTEKLNILPHEQCFDDEEDYKRYFFEEILPDNQIIVNEERERLTVCSS